MAIRWIGGAFSPVHRRCAHSPPLREEKLWPFYSRHPASAIAMIYPTVMAFIAKRYPKGSDTAITFTVTLMGLGSVIGNYAIGGVIELVKRSFGADSAIGLLRGSQAGYGVIGLCAAFSAISGIILFVYLKRRQQLI